MQRLHADDLSGILIERGWPWLAIPAIAIEAMVYQLGDEETYCRPVGQLLQPDRDSADAIEELRQELGSRTFAAQFQQNPTPADGNMIKKSWLGRYDAASLDPKSFRRIVLSCDPAGKEHTRNDYTAITVCGVASKHIHVLHVARGHWTVLQMMEQIEVLAAQWKANLSIVEDTSSGMGLIQLLRERGHTNVIGRQPHGDKVTRMARHQGRFEAGRIVLPNEASWLAEFESELLAFPNGRHDDQVDALLQFIDWYSDNEAYINPCIVAPIIVTWAGIDWSCHH